MVQITEVKNLRVEDSATIPSTNKTVNIVFSDTSAESALVIRLMEEGSLGITLKDVTPKDLYYLSERLTAVAHAAEERMGVTQ